MRPLTVLMLPLLLAPLACKPKAPQGTPWVRTAPAGTQVALSGRAGWVLDQRQFQSLVARNPLAEQVLELFLKQARISPKLDNGRISFYILDLPKDPKDLGAAADSFLLQLGGFNEPIALQTAMASAFPPEGSLTVNDKEFPLHVVLDYNQVHIRAMADAEGHIWLGELKALATLGTRGSLPKGHPILRASAWTNGKAPLQGFILPEGFRAHLKDKGEGAPRDLARELPPGIEGLVWSLQPGEGKPAIHQVELSVVGTTAAIAQITPWLQRIGALASTQQDSGAQPPELMQEPTRAGLRCQLTDTQVSQLFSKLNQPNFKFSGPEGPKP